MDSIGSLIHGSLDGTSSKQPGGELPPYHGGNFPNFNVGCSNTGSEVQPTFRVSKAGET